MGYRQDGAGKLLQIILQNGQGHHIQIVGRLVQQKHVRGFHQHGQQVESSPLASGKLADGHTLQIRREQEPLHHLLGGEGALHGFHFPGNLMDEVVHPLAQIQFPALLREMADFHGGALLHRAGIRQQLTGDHMQQRRFSRAVGTHDADPVGTQQVKGEVPDDPPSVKGFGHSFSLDDLPAQTAGCGRKLEGIVRFRGGLVL